MATKNIRKAYEMRTIAVKEMRRTAFGPKYSFTISVITNSRGHRRTPHVRLIDKPLRPNSVKLDGLKPNNFSSEKIFVPIVSAIRALQQKKAVIPRKSLVGLSFRIECIMNAH